MNKKIKSLIATGITLSTAIVGISAIASVGISNVAKVNDQQNNIKQEPKQETATENLESQNNDYVEEDDLSNLPSDQELGIQPAGGHEIGQHYIVYSAGRANQNWDDLQRNASAQGDVKKSDWWRGNFSNLIDWGNTMDNTGFLQGGTTFVDWWKSNYTRITNWSRNYATDGKGWNCFYEVLSPTMVKMWIGWEWYGWHKIWFTIDRFEVANPTTYPSDQSELAVTSGYTGYYPSQIGSGYSDSILTPYLNKGASSNARVDSFVQSHDNKNGTVYTKVYIRSAMDSHGNVTDWGPYYQTITGFPRWYATQINNGKLPGAEELKVNQVSEDWIRTKLPGSGLIQHPWSTVTSADLSVDITGTDPENSTITCDITINNSKATNDKADPVSSITFTGVKFNGFKQILVTKLLTRSFNVTSAELMVNDVEGIKRSNKIKDLIKAQISNPSSTLSTSDITIDTVTPDIPNGTASINITVAKWTNSDGNVTNSHKENNITLTGLKRIVQTTFASGSIDCTGCGITAWDENAIKQNSKIKEAIGRSVQHPGEGFSATTDISITGVTAKNPVEGTATVSITVNKWVRADGNKENHSLSSVSLIKLNKMTATSFNTSNTINCSTANITATDKQVIKDNPTVKDLISKNVQNPTPGFSASGVTITEVTENNEEEGTATVSITVSNWLNNDGTVSSNHPITGVKLNGFTKVEKSTTIQSSIAASVLFPGQTLTPADLTDSIVTEAIVAKKDDIFTNLPGSIDSSNISGLTITEQSQENGTAKVSFDLSNSKPANKHFEFTITNLAKTITGFKNETITVTGQTESSLTIGEDKIKELVVQNVGEMLQNTPEGYSPSADQITLRDVDRKKDGKSLTVYVTFPNVYTNSGKGNYEHQYTIQGFKGLETTLKSETLALGNSSQYASDLDDAKVAELVQGHLADVLENYDPATVKVTASNWQPTERKDSGTVDLVFTGVWGNDGTMNKSVTITGFKATETTAVDGDNKTFSTGDAAVLAKNAANDSEAKKQVKQHLTEILVNAPTDYNIETNVTISNLAHDDKEGNISFKATFNKLYSTVVGQDTTVINQDITITGYKPMETSIKDGGNFSFGTQTVLASTYEGNADKVKDLLIEHKEQLLDNAPEGFKFDDKTNYDVSNIVPDNKNGTLKFDLTVNNVYGPSKTDKLVNVPITISGFKSENTSFIKQTVDFGDATKLASDVDAAWIKSKVIENIDQVVQGLPPHYQANEGNNVQVDQLDPDDKHGTLTFHLTFNGVYASNGGTTIDQTTTLRGFKVPVSTFKNNGTYNFGDSSIKANQDATKEKLTQKVLTRFNDIVEGAPKDFTPQASNISIGTINPNEAAGSIRFELTITGVYGEHDSDSISREVTFTGYESQNTSWLSETPTLNIGNTYNGNASKAAKDTTWIKKQVKDHIKELVTSLPSDFDANRDCTIENPSGNDAKGELTFTLTITKILSTTGQSSTSKVVTITGFSAVITKINSSVYINNDSVYATDPSVTEDSIKQVVENNISKFATGLPDNYVARGKVTIVGSLERNAKEGIIIFTLKLTEVNTTEGFVQSQVTLSGYNTKQTTTTIEQNPTIPEGTSDKLPSEMSTDEIKQQIIDSGLISGSYNGKPLTANDIEVQIVGTDDKTGEVKVNVTIPNGGWINGEYVPNLNLGEITIGGFNKTNTQLDWWLWAAIGGALLFLILLIVLLVLLAKKKKIKNIKINAISAPPRPASQQLAHKPNQIATRPVATAVPHKPNGPGPKGQTTTTTKVVKKAGTPAPGQVQRSAASTTTTTKRVVKK